MKIDDLAGRRILITGASTGIGAAAALAFAGQGASVALHYREHEDEAARTLARLPAAKPSHVKLRADLGTRGAAQALVSQAAAALGGLDILINNAGSLIARRPFVDIDDELIDSVFDLNVRAVIHATRAAIPFLEKGVAPSIINVGSIAGMDGGGPGSAVYASSKAFVHNLTRHLARDLAPRGIRVNTVSPGPVVTPWWTDAGGVADLLAGQAGTDRDGVLSTVVPEAMGLSTGSMATPQHVADAVALLVSPRSASTTGADVAVDSGFVKAV